MFCSIRQYDGCTDVTELTSRIHDELMPMFREMDGFIELKLVDGGDERVTWINLFATEEQADDASDQIGDIVSQSLIDLLPELPEITIGEVVIDNRK